MMLSAPPSAYDAVCTPRVHTVEATVVDIDPCTAYPAALHEIVHRDGLFYVSTASANITSPLLANSQYTKGYTTYEAARLASVAAQIAAWK